MGNSVGLQSNPFRRFLRWSAAIALIAVAPKCFLCAAAYLGLGAVLGFGGPELCGVSSSTIPAWGLPLLAIGLLLVAARWVWRKHRRRPNAAGTLQ